MEQESKVVYSEGNLVRVIRGVVHVEGEFIKVERRDGTILVATRNVISINTDRGVC